MAMGADCNSLETGAIVIVGRLITELGKVTSKSDLRDTFGSWSTGLGDTDRLLCCCSGDADRLRQFLSHSSGVIKLPPLPSPLSIKCGFISR